MERKGKGKNKMKGPKKQKNKNKKTREGRRTTVPELMRYAMSEGIGPLNISWKSIACQPNSLVSVKKRLSPRRSPCESVIDLLSNVRRVHPAHIKYKVRV